MAQIAKYGRGNQASPTEGVAPQAAHNGGLPPVPSEGLASPKLFEEIAHKGAPNLQDERFLKHMT